MFLHPIPPTHPPSASVRSDPGKQAPVAVVLLRASQALALAITLRVITFLVTMVRPSLSPSLSDCLTVCHHQSI